VTARFAGTGVEVAAVALDADGGLALPAVMRRLAEWQINEVLVECGPRLAGALIRAAQVDELLLYLAPCLLGEAARPLARLPGLERLADAPRWRLLDQWLLAPDLRLRLAPERE
jgi:diaminohydroxyphosphoribosylaminopyrimidine deaminase (EC 3.5.4.26)/5-amino-6-(5-phosphoribosylamino)uracil reductase (EC 1.1.1.193)